MNKFLGIIILGLLLSSNAYAKEIKVYHKDENSISVKGGAWTNVAKFKVIASKHCAQYKKFAFRFVWGHKHGALDEKGKPEVPFGQLLENSIHLKYWKIQLDDERKNARLIDYIPKWRKENE